MADVLSYFDVNHKESVSWVIFPCYQCSHMITGLGGRGEGGGGEWYSSASFSPGFSRGA